MKKIKSAMLILMVAIGFASFVSCGNNKNAQPNDAKAVAEALEDKEVEEMSSLINSVSLCLDSIQVQENMIFNNLKAQQTSNTCSHSCAHSRTCSLASSSR